MTTELGTELGTTLGTELGSMETEGAPTFDAAKVYAATSMSAANYYATGTGGGEGGDAAGFGFLILARIPTQAVGSAGRALADNLFTGPVEGWTANTSATNTGILAAFVNAAAGSISTPTYTVAPSDVGKILCVLGQHTGAGNTVRLMVTRGVFTSAAIAGYTPSTTRRTGLGIRANVGNIPGDNLEHIGFLTFRGVPSDAQLVALFDAARSANDVPTSVSGATLAHRWSLKTELAKAALPVADGAAGPATIADSVTAASVDAMAKTGSPTVKVIDPGLYPRTSYGALGFTTTSYLEAASLSRTAATGHWFALWARPDSIAANGQSFKHLLDFTRGTIYVTNGSTVNVNNGTVNIASAALTASAAGVPMLITGVFRGSSLEAYINGVSLGTPTATTDSGGASILRLGANVAGTSFAQDWTLYGYAMGRVSGGITAQEVLDHYNACAATGRIATIAGKTEHHVDLTQDVVANGGPTNGIPATVQDRVGTDHLSRVGSGLVVSPRTERLWSYETSPIAYGGDGWSNANYYTSSFNDTISTNAGWWWALLAFMPTATVVNGVMAGARGADLNSGWDLRPGTNNASLLWYMGDGSGFNASGAAPVALDKINLFVGAWDGPGLKQRFYNKRLEVGTGTARTAYAPPTTTPIGIGRSLRDPSSAVPNKNILGFAMGQGTPTLAQVQALYDLVQASESMQSIPGMAASVLVDLTQDSPGGALPASLSNRGTLGGSFARTGTPTVTSHFARAWAW